MLSIFETISSEMMIKIEKFYDFVDNKHVEQAAVRSKEIMTAVGDKSHGFDHIVNVIEFVERIGNEDEKIMLVAKIIAYFHDVEDGKLKERNNGRYKVKDELEKLFDNCGEWSKVIEIICKLIDNFGISKRLKKYGTLQKAQVEEKKVINKFIKNRLMISALIAQCGDMLDAMKPDVAFRYIGSGHKGVVYDSKNDKNVEKFLDNHCYTSIDFDYNFTQGDIKKLSLFGIIIIRSMAIEVLLHNEKAHAIALEMFVGLEENLKKMRKSFADKPISDYQ